MLQGATQAVRLWKMVTNTHNATHIMIAEREGNVNGCKLEKRRPYGQQDYSNFLM